MALPDAYCPAIHTPLLYVLIKPGEQPTAEWLTITGLLFVNLYFDIFNLPAGRLKPCSKL